MDTIDNVTKTLGDDLKVEIKKNAKLKIAAAYFSIYAFEALKKELENVDTVEFIFTHPTFVPDEVTDQFKKERREFYIPKAEREKSFYGTDFEIQLKNKLNQKGIAKECADWIRKKAKFKSNKTNQTMQSYLGVDNGENSKAVYLPISGFTAVDLGYQQGDAISNFINKIDESIHTSKYLKFFDQIWNDNTKVEDITERLCEHITSVYKENSPQKIYFLMLYNIFNEFLEDLNEDVLPNDLTGYQNSLIWNKLYNFQKDAATGIINKLETFNGCILADSVGLGKTFTALSVIKYYELRNKSVLVLCPKKLSENWLKYNRNLVTNPFVKDRFNYMVLCHTDLLRTRGESLGTPLDKVNWGNFDLIVIDESHNFRTNDSYKEHETRYQRLLNKVIKEGVKTKVLMLSATPVNNRFNDLKNQLALAFEGHTGVHEGRLKKLGNIDEIFKRAQAAFNRWSSLPAEKRTAAAILEELDFDFFELLDKVTIARSRKHIQTYYDTKDIGKFPDRNKPITFHSPLTSRNDVFSFNEIFHNLSLISMAVYAPMSYVLDSRRAYYEQQYDTEVSTGGANLKQVDREKSLQRLMTVNLLKRLESSVHSFRLTLDSLRKTHQNTLKIIDDFEKGNRQRQNIDDYSAEMDSVDFDDDNFSDAEFEADTIGKKIQIKLEDMDLISWKAELEGDLKIIDGLYAEMSKVTPENDSKLQSLRTQIVSKISSPINPGNKKVLIFTAFADTADYLYNNIASDILVKHRVHTAKVTGSGSPKTTIATSRGSSVYDFETVLTLFSPESKEKASIMPNNHDQIDILIGTDCISEGQNLQDCDYLINYDIHWNPVRIIQRFGRIDRIGSKNKVIQLVNYWPDITLDEYINLKERVESRMIIADVTATGDDNVLNQQSQDAIYRKEQLLRLQEEVIELEDLRTGVSITDLGLNDFRMDLINYIKTNPDLESLPNGMHAVLSANESIGLKPGVIFTLRNRTNSININQQNRLHPYYLVYVSDQGETIVKHTEVKKILDLVRLASKDQVDAINAACEAFNRETNDGKNMQFYSNLLDNAVKSIIEVKEEDDIDNLFKGGKTTALTGAIKGLNDFELISFLVIKDVN